MNKEFNRRQLGTALRLGLSVALLALLFSRIDFGQLIGHLLSLHLGYYALGLACYFGFIGLWAARWRFILQAAGEQVGFRRVFMTTLVGNFFALFLPEVVGSDLARMHEVSSERRASAAIVSTVLLDRVVGLASIVLMALVALVVGSRYLEDPAIGLTLGGLLALFVVGWRLFFERRFMNWWFDRLFRLARRFEGRIRNLYEALYHLHEQPRLLAGSLILALLVQVVEVVSVILIARAMDVQAAPGYFFIFLPLIWIVTALPVSLSGLGVREGAFAFFFTQVGVAASEAVAMSLLYYSFRVITGLVGGLAFLKGSAERYLAAQRT